MHIHIHHHMEFDEASEFVKLVRAVHQNQLLLLQGNEVIMAQLDDLMSALQAISTDVTTEVSRLNDLQSQLTQLQNSTPPTVDLQPAIDLANSIRQNLEGTASTASDATSGNSDTTTQSSGADTSSSGSSTGDSGLGTISSGGASDPSVDPSAGVISGDTGTADSSQPQ